MSRSHVRTLRIFSPGGCRYPRRPNHPWNYLYLSLFVSFKQSLTKRIGTPKKALKRIGTPTLGGTSTSSWSCVPAVSFLIVSSQQGISPRRRPAGVVCKKSQSFSSLSKSEMAFTSLLKSNTRTVFVLHITLFLFLTFFGSLSFPYLSLFV